jgi:hypothetical protein
VTEVRSGRPCTDSTVSHALKRISIKYFEKAKMYALNGERPLFSQVVSNTNLFLWNGDKWRTRKGGEKICTTPSKIIRRINGGGDSTNLSADRSGVSDSSCESSLYHHFMKVTIHIKDNTKRSKGFSSGWVSNPFDKSNLFLVSHFESFSIDLLSCLYRWATDWGTTEWKET